MTYTKSIENQKYFLNDKNIAQELKYGDIAINAIPSLDLVSAMNDRLSAEDKRLNDYLVSVETSAYTISSVVDARLQQLSNAVSSYSDALCASISIQVENNRIADKKELSATLSSYVDSEISDLSATVNKEYVHKAGDNIASITVDNVLNVTNETYLNGKTYVYGNIVHGKDTKVLGIDRGIVLGVSATVENEDALVWNGDTDRENYTSHAKGTFNINPVSGSEGLYIGEKTLSSLIKEDVNLTAQVLTAQISAASALVSSWVDSRRTTDRIELSNALSTYSNKLCSDLSVRIEQNRAADRYDLSSNLSNYSDALWANLSNSISTGGYVNYNTAEFISDTEKHLLKIVLKDNYDHISTLSVDTTDFIKNRIVDHVLVVNPPDVAESVLRIFWANASAGELTYTDTYTDIKIADLAKIYVKGDGINITPDLSIEVDNTVARTADLLGTKNTLYALSTYTVPEIDAHAAKMQDYIDQLSSPDKFNPGIILQISNAITSDVANLVQLSSDSKAISSTTNSRLNSVSADVDVIKAFDDMLSVRVNGTDVGVIPDISIKLENLAKTVRANASYAGKIQFNKYHPDFETAGKEICLSDVFEYYSYGTLTNPIKNGNIYEIIFDEPIKTDLTNVTYHDDILSDYYDFSNPVFAADQFYDCKDYRLAHRDFVQVVVNDYTTEYIPLKDVATYAKTLAGGAFYQTAAAAVSSMQSQVWLSGNNNDDAVWMSHVERHENRPVIILNAGHCISGHNHFVDGDNRFDGYNFIEELSAQSLSTDKFSVSYLSACRIDADEISACYLSVSNFSIHRLDAYDISVGNNLSVANMLSVQNNATFASTVQIKNNLSIDNALTATPTQTDVISLSAGKISADWKEIKHSTGYSLFDLSTALSNKIWIDNQVDDHAVNGTSDLSIVKIKKDNYDALVIGTTPLSANTLYVIDSDYIDAYGQAISNVVMSADGLPAAAYSQSEATNKNYVDCLCGWISADASLSAQNLSAYVRKIQNKVEDTYRAVSAISETSYLSDVISAVVKIAHSLSDIWQVNY